MNVNQKVAPRRGIEPLPSDRQSGTLPLRQRGIILERVAGNDPASLVRQTSIIPLYDTRVMVEWTGIEPVTDALQVLLAPLEHATPYVTY
jgi:hypothetical protein